MFPRTIYARPACRGCRSPTYQESSSDFTGSDTASDTSQIIFQIKKNNANRQHPNKSERHNLKKLESKATSPSSDRSLTLSAESSPFLIDLTNNVTDRGTSFDYLSLNTNDRRSHYSAGRHNIGSGSSHLKTGPKYRIPYSPSRTYRRSPDCKSYKSHCSTQINTKPHCRSHHRHHSHEERRKKHCNQSNSSKGLTSSSGCTRYRSNYKGTSHRSKLSHTDTGARKQNYHKPCSKHRTNHFFSRKYPSTFDYGGSINRNNTGLAAASVCQILSQADSSARRNRHNSLRRFQSSQESGLSETDKICRTQSSQDSNCGCSRSKPCANFEFCEGCNATLLYRRLVEAYSEPAISDSCTYHDSMIKNVLKSNSLAYSNLPIRYDKRLGEFLDYDDDYDSHRQEQVVDLDDKGSVRLNGCRNKISWENFWMPASGFKVKYMRKSRRRKPNW